MRAALFAKKTVSLRTLNQGDKKNRPVYHPLIRAGRGFWPGVKENYKNFSP